jgi:hypothetical protein
MLSTESTVGAAVRLGDLARQQQLDQRRVQAVGRVPDQHH